MPWHATTLGSRSDSAATRAAIFERCLSRVDVSVYPASHVAYINCQMGSHIALAGWTITGGAAPSGLRFWEYQSTDPSGNPID
jgi:hypothetical protein